VDKKISLLLLLVLVSVSLSAFSMAEADAQDSANMLYNKARSLMLNRDYAAAAAQFEIFSNNYRDHVRRSDALFSLGFCLEKVGDDKEAFKYYQEASKAPGNRAVSMRASSRAAALAAKLHNHEGDTYELYIQKTIQSRTGLFSAISMARAGKWEVLPILIEGLKSGHEIERIQISEILSYQMKNEKVQQSLLRAMKNDKNQIVRVNAVRALSLVSKKPKIQKAILSAMESDDNQFVRRLAARILYKFNTNPVVIGAFMRMVIEEKNQFVIHDIFPALLATSNADTYIELIKQRLGKEEDTVIKLLLSTLISPQDFGGDIVVEITSLASDPRPDVKYSAMRMLSRRTEDPKVVVFFTQKLVEGVDETSQVIALNALSGKSGQKEVREAVVDIVVSSEDDLLRSNSIRFLEPVIHLEDVKRALLSELEAVKSPLIAGQLTYVLSSELSDPDIQGTIIKVISDSESEEFTFAIAAGLEAGEGDLKLIADRIEVIINKETNPKVIARLLNLYKRIDLKKAREIAEKLKLKK
jgi:tetratricopeptide (TPR) repeat protein